METAVIIRYLKADTQNGKLAWTIGPVQSGVWTALLEAECDWRGRHFTLSKSLELGMAGGHDINTVYLLSLSGTVIQQEYKRLLPWGNNLTSLARAVGLEKIDMTLVEKLGF